jgi:hypothetical protein
MTKQGSHHMSVDDEAVRELEMKLFEATVDYDRDVIFNALRRIIIYWMSTTCASCRKHIAREWKRSVPEMLAEANAFAAENPFPPDGHTH